MSVVQDRCVLERVPRLHFYQGGPACPEDIPVPSAMRALTEYLGDQDLGCQTCRGLKAGCSGKHARIPARSRGPAGLRLSHPSSHGRRSDACATELWRRSGGVPSLPRRRRAWKGFPADRFRDSVLLAEQAKPRFPLFWVLWAAVFADVGEVAPAWSAMTAAGIHGAYGAGLRVFPSVR